ncbi:ABC transporter permease [Salarchaeum sp. III]|uniref:ABC transporter permease n=1 Tax=Salarchaeum sp. III TaxID=3107927 RepID=UPI002ED9326E
MTDRIGDRTLLLAVLTVQVVAFALSVALGYPTLYAVFMVVSAIALAYGADAGVAGMAGAALAAVLLVALAFPLALFTARQDPGLVLEKLRDPAVHRMLYVSLYAPLLAAAFAVLTGLPLAYLLSRDPPGGALLQSVVDLPLVVPHAVAGIVVLFGFGEGGALPGLPVLGTVVGAVLAMTFVSAPYAVNSIRNGFDSVDSRVEHAARVHGASRFETFRRVTLPLAARGVLTGGVLAWARSVSEFGAVAVVAYTIRFFYPPAWETVSSSHAPVFVFKTYLAGSLDEANAVAFVLLAVSIGIFVVVRRVADDGGRVL